MNFIFYKPAGLQEKSLFLTLNRKILLFRITLFFLLLFWCLGFNPGLLSLLYKDSIIFSPILKKFYSSVCHQAEDRSMFIFGDRLLVCARCTGIYIGALAFSLMLTFTPRILINKKLFLIGLSALIADVLLNSSAIFSYSKYSAFVTGFFFGSVAFLYIYVIVETEFFKKE